MILLLNIIIFQVQLIQIFNIIYNPNETIRIGSPIKYNNILSTNKQNFHCNFTSNNISLPKANNDKTIRIGSPIKYKIVSIPNVQSTTHYMNNNPLSSPTRNYISTANVSFPISHKTVSIPAKSINNSPFITFSPYRNDIKTINAGSFIPHQSTAKYNIITHPITYHNTSNNISTVRLVQPIRYKNISIPN